MPPISWKRSQQCCWLPWVLHHWAKLLLYPACVECLEYVKGHQARRTSTRSLKLNLPLDLLRGGKMISVRWVARRRRTNYHYNNTHTQRHDYHPIQQHLQARIVQFPPHEIGIEISIKKAPSEDYKSVKNVQISSSALPNTQDNIGEWLVVTNQEGVVVRSDLADPYKRSLMDRLARCLERDSS